MLKAKSLGWSYAFTIISYFYCISIFQILMVKGSGVCFDATHSINIMHLCKNRRMPSERVYLILSTHANCSKSNTLIISFLCQLIATYRDYYKSSTNHNKSNSTRTFIALPNEQNWFSAFDFYVPFPIFSGHERGSGSFLSLVRLLNLLQVVYTGGHCLRTVARVHLAVFLTCGCGHVGSTEMEIVRPIFAIPWKQDEDEGVTII